MWILHYALDENHSKSCSHGFLVPHNRRCGSLHHVCFGSKPTWCFLCLQVLDTPPRQLSGINRRCGELRDVSSLIDV